eukprot:4200769-Pyramimonas_sp.AAC.1
MRDSQARRFPAQGASTHQGGRSLRAAKSGKRAARVRRLRAALSCRVRVSLAPSLGSPGHFVRRRSL